MLYCTHCITAVDAARKEKRPVNGRNHRPVKSLSRTSIFLLIESIKKQVVAGKIRSLFYISRLLNPYRPDNLIRNMAPEVPYVVLILITVKLDQVYYFISAQVYNSFGFFIDKYPNGLYMRA